MDLTTLIAACALTADPKIMHALVWHQSGGEPFAFQVPGERRPQVFKTSDEAVRAARAVRPGTVVIRVGLAGLPAAAMSVTPSTFAPCANIAAAARAITELSGACRASARATNDGGACAIAAWHGSWERPDDGFAGRVVATVGRGDAPDFQMPDGTRTDAEDAGAPSLAPAPGTTPAAPATAAPPTFSPPGFSRPVLPPPAPRDDARANASPLFPRPDHSPAAEPSTDGPAADTPSGGAPPARSAAGRPAPVPPKNVPETGAKPAATPPMGSLFVPRPKPPSAAKTE